MGHGHSSIPVLFALACFMYFVIIMWLCKSNSFRAFVNGEKKNSSSEAQK